MNIYNQSNFFCVYLTIYTGNKLPPFYIGSTSIKQINDGYLGSVSSNEYKEIWNEEKRNNPNLFKIKIVSIHNSRVDAYKKEQKLQKLLNVVSSPLYLNKIYALERHDNTGKTLDKIWRENLSKSTKGKPKSELTKSRMRKPKTEDHNKKVSEAKLKMKPVTCPHCNKQGNKAVMSRFHFNNCKLNPTRIEKLTIVYECPFCNKISKSKSNMTRYHFDNCKFKS